MNPIAGYDATWTLVPFLFFAVIFVGGVLVVALSIWLTYTIIWKGVARGLEEYYGPGTYRGFTLPETSEQDAARSQAGERRHRSGRLSR